MLRLPRYFVDFTFIALACCLLSSGCFDFGAAPPAKTGFAPLLPGPTDEDAPKEFTTTESGLKYRILRKTDGVKPTTVNSVWVHYKGWLDNGKEFDNSYEKRQAQKMRVSNVIDAWKEGLCLVPEGGMIELEVPPKLGYGSMAKPNIPANSTLHFIIELQEIAE